MLELIPNRDTKKRRSERFALRLILAWVSVMLLNGAAYVVHRNPIILNVVNAIAFVTMAAYLP